MVFGISMVKDEADVVEATVRRMLDQVDRVLVADNGSTDGTREILDRLAGDLPVTVRDDHEQGYWQSRKMTALAADAGEMGASWIVPFDADEVWYSPFGRIADVLAEHPEASIATATLYDHVATGADPAEPDPTRRIGWRRREPGELPKVACRQYARVTIHQGNHGADHGAHLDGLLVVRHFPYRSVEQFVSKVRNGAAAYAATDLPEDQGQHWRDYGRILAEGGPDALGDVFRQWFWTADPTGDSTLIYDPCPA